MPQTKHILVLANSLKKGGRCVAGRELVTGEDGKTSIGPWIRPIDPTGEEGTISTRTVIIAGQWLRLLDVVEIDFDGPANDQHHPEDWRIAVGTPWRKIDAKPSEILNTIPDDSGDLWGAATAGTRKVHPSPGIPTLRLLKPTGAISVDAFRDNTQWGVKHRRFLNVEHQGFNHRFNIDDPDFDSRHNLRPADVGDKTIHLDLNPKRTIVTVSLTPPFNGEHYKIAAAIFEM